MNATAARPNENHAGFPRNVAEFDEAALLGLLDEAEPKPGFIPREVSDEVARLIEVRLERLRRIQGELNAAPAAPTSFRTSATRAIPPGRPTNAEPPASPRRLFSSP